MAPTLNFKGKRLIGVVHLKPLPGAPRYQGSIEEILEAAVADARSYERGGAHAIFIENFGDAPFTKGPVGPDTIAGMAAVGRAIRKAIRIPIGFNVLRNDARAALGLCECCGGSFVRVNVLTGAMLTDQGLIEGDAYDVLRYRQQLCPNTQILADVHVKHGVPLGAQLIEQSARDTLERGLADALIISGRGTGMVAAIEDVKRVRQACPHATILLGSGVTLDNVENFRPLADGFIVGTWLKKGGLVTSRVDPKRVAALVRRMAAG